MSPTPAVTEAHRTVDLTHYGCSRSLLGAQSLIHFTMFEGKQRRILSNCGVESALRFANPTKHNIVVWTDMAASVAELFPYMNRSDQDRVTICPKAVDEVFHKTPLERWYKSGNHTLGPYAVVNLSDGFRLALLWHLGGLYTDTDIMAMHAGNFDSNCNFQGESYSKGMKCVCCVICLIWALPMCPCVACREPRLCYFQ
jgi:hypothetical protein